MPSPVCGLTEEKLYAYQPGPENGNFGLLRSYDLSNIHYVEDNYNE